MAEALSVLQAVVMTADTLRRSINECRAISGKLRLFHDRLGALGASQRVWEDQITKFGLSDDEDLLRIIRKAQATLDEEKAKLFGSNHSGRIRISSRITCWLFPAVLESSIQKVTTFCEELNRFNVTREKQFEELARDRALKRASSFPFRPDSRYIPLEETEGKVKRALTNSGDPSIILLHGASGTGKSALARNMALHFQTESQERSGSPQMFKPSDATFQKVVFLECGPEVTLGAKQRELAEKLDPSSNNFDVIDVNSAGKAPFNVKLLSGLLKESSLLIILDDVWQTKSELATERPSFLRGLVHHGGKRVKWLITSQSKHICDHLNLGDLCVLSMEKVKLADARRILVSLTNLQESDISELQDVMDRIIDKTGTNLLALACVASSMSRERKTDKQEWKRLEMDLFNTLEKEAAIGIQSIDYGRSYWGAIRFGFMRLTLPQKHLLNLIQLCSGPSIPSSVIEYLFHKTKQQSWREGFANARNELEDKQLLTIQRITTDTAFGEKESWSIHDLLREFIKQEYLGSLDDSMIANFSVREDQINITEGPTSKLEIDVLIHVAHLYFDEHYSIQLLSIMSFLSTLSHLVDSRKEIIGPITRLLMHVDDKRCTSSLRSSILQVSLKYAQDGKFEEVQTSTLLNSSESQVPMVEALYKSAKRPYHPVIGQQIMDTLLSLLDTHTAQLVEPLAKHLSGSYFPPNLPARISYIFTVSLIKSENERRATYLASAGLQAVLEKLTTGLVGVDEVSNRCASILRSLGCGHEDIRVKMIEFPGLLQNLMIAMSRDDYPAFQEDAIYTLSNLANRGDHNKVKILDFPGLLQTLVTLIRTDDSPALQETAIYIVQNLAGGGDHSKVKILDFPGLLQTLVIVAGRGDSPALQNAAISNVGNLATGGDHSKAKILDFPGLLQTLVTVMRTDDSPALQEAATRVFRNLAKGGDDIKAKILDFPGLLQTLVAVTGRGDSSASQEAAAWAVWNLAKGNDDIKVKILDFPGLLQTLVTVMRTDDSPALQEAATRVFRNLAKGGDDIKAKILDFPGLLQTLVAVTGRGDSSASQEAAAWAVWNLAKGNDDIKVKILDFPGLLQTLVTVMRTDDSPALQEAATRVFRNLAKGGDDIKAKILDFPGLLQTLVAVTGRGDSPASQKAATLVVCNLANGNDDIKVKILDFPGLLQTLVTVMRTDDSPALQEVASCVFLILAGGGDDVKVKILNFPGLLQALVTVMQRDDSLAVQKQAAQGLHNLEYGVNILCGGALASMAIGGDAVLRKMVVNFPEMVEVLVEAMGKSDRFDTDFGDGMLVLTMLSPVRAKEMQLDSVVAYLGRGRGELLLGHYKECLEDFGRYLASLSGPLEENPNAKDVRRLIHTWSCYAKAKLGDFQGALADADCVVQMVIGMNGEAFALQERGVVKRMMGDLLGALADLNSSLGLKDDDYEVLKHRGFVKFLLNDEEGARADGERAIKCKPSYVDQSDYGKDVLGATSVQYLNFELR